MVSGQYIYWSSVRDYLGGQVLGGLLAKSESGKYTPPGFLLRQYQLVVACPFPVGIERSWWM